MIIFNCQYCGNILKTSSEAVIACQCQKSIDAEIAERERVRVWREERARNWNKKHVTIRKLTP